MKRLLIITAITLFLASCKRDVTNLEVYTSNNIYYINGLTVTNEVNNDTLTFNNMASLKNYVSDITANNTKNYKRDSYMEQIEEIENRYFKYIGKPETIGEQCKFECIVYGEKECTYN